VQLKIPKDLIPIEEARKAFSTNPNRTTFWRWIKGHGTGGIRLKTWRIVNRLYTTHAALEEFIAATTVAPEDDQPTQGKPGKRGHNAR